MSDMKCPYCNKTLHCGATLKSDEYLIDLYQCANPECESTEFLVGCKEFWDILGQYRRTRKALDVALDGLTTIGGYLDYNDCVGIALDTEDKIYEILEQKD